MKKKIVKSLLLLFVLFAFGGGVAIFSLRQINNDLSALISLHRVEIIRQDLVINVQIVQGNLFTVGTGFSREVDEIVRNVTILDHAVNRCSGCHHRESVATRINKVQKLVGQYKEALSAYLTTVANERRITRVKSIAANIGEQILEMTQEMTFIANKSLQSRTADAIKKVVRIQHLLTVTLALTMLIGFIVAISLTRRILFPIGKLVEAAKEVSAGKLGHTTDFQDDTEFSDFAHTFNEMSLSLKKSHDRNISYMHRLSAMLKGTVSLYSASDVWELIKITVETVQGIVKVGQVGVIVFDKTNSMFCLVNPDAQGAERCLSPKKVQGMYEQSGKKAVYINEMTRDEWPLKEMDGDFRPANLAMVWLKHKGECRGLIRMLDKSDGGFDSEDLKLLIILANNFSVAFDNIALYSDLRNKMQELQETQEQLVQAAKLAAIGEIASNVAHEINNPLTSILGYAELMREEDDRDSILRDIDIIEQESLRAREIVRQLLEFSRKKPLELKTMNVNEILKDVLKLVSLRLKGTSMRIEENYGEIPETMVDSDQLKQVFLNMINNAFAAMGEGGTLTLDTYSINEEIAVSISDTGPGIDEEALPRIFEPFFTTKQDKGTGLGLSISYRIVAAHNGRIDVTSRRGEGTRFTITLPVRRVASHVSL